LPMTLDDHYSIDRTDVRMMLRCPKGPKWVCKQFTCYGFMSFAIIGFRHSALIPAIRKVADGFAEKIRDTFSLHLEGDKEERAGMRP